MDSKQLEDKMREILGFRVTERENDAVVEFYEDGKGDSAKIRAVRPAHAAEVTMYIRLLGFVTATWALTEDNEGLRDKLFIAENDRKALQTRIVEASKGIDAREVALSKCERSIQLMGDALQAADARIKELLQANTGLGEERERFMEQNDQLQTRVTELEEGGICERPDHH